MADLTIETGTLAEAEQSLRAYLEMVSGFNREHHSGYPKRGGPMELLLRRGRWFTPGERARPKGMRKQPNRECFKNAAHLAMNRPELTYVEGWAIGFALPVHHAWCVDRKGNVVDPTWKTPGAAYLGIPFTEDFVWEILGQRGMYGLLSHGGVDYRKPLPKGSVVPRLGRVKGGLPT